MVLWRTRRPGGKSFIATSVSIRCRELAESWAALDQTDYLISRKICLNIESPNRITLSALPVVHDEPVIDAAVVGHKKRHAKAAETSTVAVFSRFFLGNLTAGFSWGSRGSTGFSTP